MLLLNKKYTDTLIEQTRTRPQETPEIKMNKQMEFFSSSPAINLVEEGKWLLALTSVDVTNSLYNFTNENNRFSITIPDYWSPRGGAETIIKLQELLQLKEQDDLELHLEEVSKKENHIKKEIKNIKNLTLILIKMR